MPTLSRTTLSALALCLSAAGVAAAADPPAPDCSAEAMTVTAASGEQFACTRNCVGDFSRFRFLRSSTLRGDRATAEFCMSQCEMTRGCTSVSYTIGVAPLSDGTSAPIAHCQMYSMGPTGTYDHFDKRPGHQNGICNRILPPLDLRHDRGFQTEARRFYPDLHRPIVPYQVGTPGVPNRK